MAATETERPQALALDGAATVGRLLLWSPWLVRRAARKVLWASVGG
jgi:hypothetical protein